MSKLAHTHKTARVVNANAPLILLETEFNVIFFW